MNIIENCIENGYIKGNGYIKVVQTESIKNRN